MMFNLETSHNLKFASVFLSVAQAKTDNGDKVCDQEFDFSSFYENAVKGLFWFHQTSANNPKMEKSQFDIQILDVIVEQSD